MFQQNPLLCFYRKINLQLFLLLLFIVAKQRHWLHHHQKSSWFSFSHSLFYLKAIFSVLDVLLADNSQHSIDSLYDNYSEIWDTVLYKEFQICLLSRALVPFFLPSSKGRKISLPWKVVPQSFFICSLFLYSFIQQIIGMPSLCKM